MDVETRFLVLGSGIAGLSFALRVAEHGPVIVVTKKGTAESATNYAQGGIAAVIDSADSLESHVEDTLRAGAGLCDEAVVRFVIEHGPEAGLRAYQELERLIHSMGLEGKTVRKRIERLERIIGDAAAR